MSRSHESRIVVSLTHYRVLNGDGKCYSFDYRGSGYARSEGVAVIVLKRLDEALASGDNIRAVIRGTGVNHDGKTTAGMAVPSKEAQERLIQSVYARTGLSPSNTQYLEAHATGTVVGDTIEFEAAKSVFGGSDRKRPLKIGSVKSNIGHLEPLSGLAGLIKVVLMLEKDLIPPHLNFEEPKAGISFDQTMEVIRSVICSRPSWLIRSSLQNHFSLGHQLLPALVSRLSIPSDTVARTLMSFSSQLLKCATPPVASRRKA